MKPNEQEPCRQPPNESPKEVTQLIEGLERQKEDLGPIADELIELLRRTGVARQTTPDDHPA